MISFMAEFDIKNLRYLKASAQVSAKLLVRLTPKARWTKPDGEKVEEEGTVREKGAGSTRGSPLFHFTTRRGVVTVEEFVTEDDDDDRTEEGRC